MSILYKMMERIFVGFSHKDLAAVQHVYNAFSIGPFKQQTLATSF